MGLTIARTMAIQALVMGRIFYLLSISQLIITSSCPYPMRSFSPTKSSILTSLFISTYAIRHALTACGSFNGSSIAEWLWEEEHRDVTTIDCSQNLSGQKEFHSVLPKPPFPLLPKPLLPKKEWNRYNQEHWF